MDLPLHRKRFGFGLINRPSSDTSSKIGVVVLLVLRIGPGVVTASDAGICVVISPLP